MVDIQMLSMLLQYGSLTNVKAKS